MTSQVFDPKANFTLSLTDSAANFFRKKMVRQNAHAISLSVKKSGCTGYAYVIETVDEPCETDNELVLKDIIFYVSELAAPMINGSEIDLEVNGLNKNIVFNNPNITASCGCGSSFLAK